VIISLFKIYTVRNKKGYKVISREDFLFTVGFQGNAAIVDSSQKRKYGKLPTDKLLEKGLFKAALCSAIYNNNEDELELIFRKYNEKSTIKLKMRDDLKKVFGVTKVPDNIDKVIGI
jgi:hypothetical protein